MTATTAPTVYTCGRCSRETTDPDRDNWMLRLMPVVVQGKTLGLCPACLKGGPDATAEEQHCDRKCGGSYTASTGTYFEARWGHNERWSCWDEACCDAWAEEQDEQCTECGSWIDIDVVKFVDGKRVRS